jgi:hypothetical protein
VSGQGTGHPIPGSDEARHHEIPERVEAAKGRGDDPRPVIQPGLDAVAPDGELYAYDDLGRAEAIDEQERAMANDKDGSPLSGRDLQDSQSGGGSGEFRGHTNPIQNQPAGGGATASDRSSSGGSSGTGGYGASQNVTLQREGQPGEGSPSSLAEGDKSESAAPTGQSRGDRYDEAQGGGRGVMFDGQSGVSEFEEDLVSHQDRGQSKAADFDRDSD